MFTQQQRQKSNNINNILTMWLLWLFLMILLIMMIMEYWIGKTAAIIIIFSYPLFKIVRQLELTEYLEPLKTSSGSSSSSSSSSLVSTIEDNYDNNEKILLIIFITLTMIATISVIIIWFKYYYCCSCCFYCCNTKSVESPNSLNQFPNSNDVIKCNSGSDFRTEGRNISKNNNLKNRIYNTYSGSI